LSAKLTKDALLQTFFADFSRWANTTRDRVSLQSSALGLRDHVALGKPIFILLILAQGVILL